MGKVTRLVRCETCERQIAATADACPGCGARNTWLHPEIERFLDAEDEFDHLPEFNCTHDQFRLKGTAEVRRGGHAIGHYGVTLLAVGLLTTLGGVILPGGIGMIAILLGPLALVVGFVLLGVMLLQPDRSTDYVVRFSIDFSSSPPTWRCDDEDFWRDVREFFDLPRSKGHRRRNRPHDDGDHR